MAKEIKARIRLRLTGGSATPAPPVGSALGQHQVNLAEFCKQFNAQTADRKGQTVPLIVTVYTDKKFDFILKTPPASELIRKKAGLEKGSSRPNADKVGSLSQNDIEEIAKTKMADLNAFDLEQAKKIIEGTARSMGVNIV